MASKSANGYNSNMLRSSNFVEQRPLRPKTIPSHETTSKKASCHRVCETETMRDISSFSNDAFSDTSKCFVKKQIVVKNLLHAAICSSNAFVVDSCSSPRTCCALRILYDHVRRCEDRKCPVPRCANYRSAYRHLRQCTADDCVLCEPARMSSEYVHFQPRFIVHDRDASPTSLLAEHSSPPSPPRLCLGTPRRYSIPEL